MTKLISSFVGGVLVGVLIILGWNSYVNKSNIEAPAVESAPESVSHVERTVLEDSPEDVVESSVIDVRDQAAGGVVVISSIELMEDGWISIHEENKDFIGNALGAVRRDAGTHTSVSIPLLRETLTGQTYWVVIYSDSGDSQFSLKDDFPVRDSSNNPVISSFKTN